jgi:hypothetical protein
MTRPSLTEHLFMTESHRRIGFVNLGCPKALVDWNASSPSFGPRAMRSRRAMKTVEKAGDYDVWGHRLDGPAL